MCVVTVTDSRLKTTPGGSRLGTDRSSATGGVRLAAASTMRRPRTESWSYKTERTAEEQKCFEPTQRRKESCEFDQCAQALGKPAERWRRPSQDGGTRYSRRSMRSSPFYFFSIKALGLSSPFDHTNSFARAANSSRSFSRFLVFVSLLGFGCHIFSAGLSTLLFVESQELMYSSNSSHTSSSSVLFFTCNSSVILFCSSSSSIIIF